MATAQTFEELWIWQQARELVRDIYPDFGEGTPAGRDFGFRDQVRRSGVSIMNNIAEGFERASDTEFARFLDIAKGSCGEVRSMYYTAEDLGYVTATVANQRRERSKQIAAGIVALRSHLRNRTSERAEP
jgi:four helix bundle protein